MSESQKRSFNRPTLEECLESGNLIAFIGSGLSARAYPTWRELIRLLCEKCGHEIGDADTPYALMKKCDLLQSANTVQYNKALSNIFGERTLIPETYDFLLKSQFKNYVTINFDYLLANAVRKNQNDRDGKFIIYPYPHCKADALSEHKSAFYIHGYIEPGNPPDSKRPIVLSYSDFKRAYDKSSFLPSFLMQLFGFHPVCFIACELQEPPLIEVLKQAAAARENIRREYGETKYPLFMLMEEWTEDNLAKKIRHVGRYDKDQGSLVDAILGTPEDEIRCYQDFDIEVVRYPYEPDYKGLDKLLQRWANIPPCKMFDPTDGGIS